MTDPKVIDGKAIGDRLRSEIAAEVASLKERTGREPGLAAVLVGEDPASQVYVRNKRLACDKAGIYSELHRLPSTTTQAQLLDLVRRLNDQRNVNGILVQLPLPKGLDEDGVIETISPDKDVDGFHAFNVGRLMLGRPTFRSATPWGVMKLLEHAGVDPAGKEAVIVGRSNIVGKPMALMLLAAHATVTVCHSRTRDLADVVRRGEIVIAAAGKAGLVTGAMLRPGAVVIDVGTNRNSEGKLVGDVDFASALPVVSRITPVPGGVGPMTITMLLCNTLLSFRRAEGLL